MITQLPIITSHHHQQQQQHVRCPGWLTKICCSSEQSLGPRTTIKSKSHDWPIKTCITRYEYTADGRQTLLSTFYTNRSARTRPPVPRLPRRKTASMPDARDGLAGWRVPCRAGLFGFDKWLSAHRRVRLCAWATPEVQLQLTNGLWCTRGGDACALSLTVSLVLRPSVSYDLAGFSGM